MGKIAFEIKFLVIYHNSLPCHANRTLTVKERPPPAHLSMWLGSNFILFSINVAVAVVSTLLLYHVDATSAVITAAIADVKNSNSVTNTVVAVMLSISLFLLLARAMLMVMLTLRLLLLLFFFVD